MDTLGKKKVPIIEKFKQGPMYGLSAKKSACCREVALVEVRLYVDGP